MPNLYVLRTTLSTSVSIIYDLNINYQDEAHTSIETITTAAQATARALHASAIANATAEWKESPTADDHTATYVGRKKIAELEEVKVGRGNT